MLFIVLISVAGGVFCAFLPNILWEDVTWINLINGMNDKDGQSLTEFTKKLGLTDQTLQ